MSNEIAKNNTKTTVKEFVKKYNDTNVSQTKKTFIDKIMNTHYVSYEIKIAICEKIIENSYYKKDSDGNKINKLHVNSPAQYMLYCLNLVEQYTNIRIDFSNSLEEFNLLNSNDLLDVIFSRIPEKEIKEFRMILDMIENDLIQNEYETHAFIINQVERFGELFGNVAEPALRRLSDILENIDETSINKIAGKLKMLDKVNVLKKNNKK